MKKYVSSNPTAKRLSALALVLVMLLGMIPAQVFAAPGDVITTVADIQTLTRPDDIYGNDTQNAGKVTVGKSVSTGSVTVPLTDSTNKTLTASDPNNFMITVSQSAQVVGVTGETSVPVDVVFVLDTSGSMDDNNRAENMVTAANGLIEDLMASNEQNRIGVVAFSGSNGYDLEETTTVLSALDHYEDQSGTSNNNRQAASNHITWGSFGGSTLRGRNADNTVNTTSTRNGKNGGTNIQAGIARGAQMLTNASNTSVAVDTNGDGTADTQVTRMPVLIILSDGAPSYSADNAEWWDPNGSTQGAGSTSANSVDPGEGFLAMLTAAYYKKAIAQHYYGANTDQQAAIYTIGVSLGSITTGQNGSYQASNNEAALANLTMNPAEWLGKSLSGTTVDETINGYWESYQAGTDFTVEVGIKNNNSNGRYSFTASGDDANILSSVTDLKYNDKYWATGDADINNAFDELSVEISKKAMSVPTMVTTTEDFSGYVTFTDVLGEYMELKDMVGIVANGKLYEGISFAKHLSAYGESGAEHYSAEFDALLREVMQTRLNMSDSMKNDADFVEKNIELAKASANQAYYNSDTDYDNSLVWWGVTYDVGEEDTNIQNLGYADDDSIAYIEQQKAAGEIPAGADCVVRSYFFYGTAGDTDQNPNHEYLYFVVRVSRSLTAPYQQTVVISAPASLLSMERVLIHEESDGTYTAEVESQLPARVVYEVGLRSDINPYTVSQIVSDSYKNETVNGAGTLNYADGVYSFFTNDWDRSQALDSHHRAMTKATFDAAADNSFYRYQENETLYVLSGSTYTKYTGATLPNGVYYYAREGYSWSGTAVDGKYAAQPETFYIKVDVEDDNRASIVHNTADNTWYIPAGLYTASTLQVNGDDTMKDDPATAELNDGNKTNSAATVAHPHRTGDVNNSHYTVLLGNNGLLTMQAKEAKSVSIDRGGAGTTVINDADGTAVMVGDVLTYTIEAMNTTGAAADIVITDKVPAGTEFVSAANGGVHSSGTVTWTAANVAAGASASVSFQVRVTEAALDSAVVNIENQATVQIGSEPSYTTNTVTNPPEGKTVMPNTGTVHVGSVLTYEIRYANDTDTEQTVTITDIIPAGTAYIAGSASPAASYDSAADKLTWTLNNVQPGVTGTVSFRVEVTAEAVNSNNIQNYAEIKVGPNDPYVTTNSTSTQRETGSIKLLKTVKSGDTDTAFTMILTEATGTLNGTFQMTGAAGSTVTFTNGTATITGVKNGVEVTISGLPLNASIAVREEAASGWTPTYTQRIGVVASGSAVQTLQISNDYQTVPANFQLSGVKTFTGADWPNGAAVNFKAERCDENGQIVTGTGARVVYAVAAKGAGGETVFQFPERTFEEEQTLYYLVSEYVTDDNKIANVEYDQTVYLMKLEIVDEDSVLKAKTSYKKGTAATTDWSTVAEVPFNWQTNKTKDGNGADTQETAIAFENIYYSASAPLTISGAKTMTGRAMQDGEFVFELVDAAGKVVSTSLEVGSDPYAGTFTFAPITYTLADVGTHTYTVREFNGGLGGVTYDGTEYTVTVTVTKGANGTLNAVPAYAVGSEAKQAISFANSYAPTTTTTTTPIAYKKLVEKAMTENEFRFEVVELDPANGYAVMQVGGKDKVVSVGTNAAAAANAEAAVSFSPISFVDANPGSAGMQEHYYKIRETAGTDSTITYDATEYYLYVEVTDDGAGNLTVTNTTYYTDLFLTAAAGNKILFTNHYGSGEVELAVDFDKKFNYADTDAWIGMSGSEFDFEVYAADSSFAAVSSTPITIGANAASGTDGKAEIIFVPTHITKAQMADAVLNPTTGLYEKTFYYLVHEVTPSNAAALNMGIAADIGVKLTVTNDGYGNLTASAPEYFRETNGTWEAQTGTDKNLFINTYNTKEVSIRIPVDKILQGKDLTYTGGADKFTFQLEGGNLAQPVTLTTDENGLAAHTLTFKAEDMSGAAFDSERGAWGKTFTFTVSEKDISSGLVNGETNGTYTKDPTVYTVKVFVTEDGSGQLKAAAYVGSERLEVLTFTNTYTPDPVTLDVDEVLGSGKVTKSVTYPDGTPVAGYDLTKFKFSVVDAMGNKLSTGTTDANGTVTFDPVLTFSEARDYHYWIVEDSTTAAGITIDQRRWELHVNVGYDAASGKLSINSKNIYPVNRVAEPVAEIEFVNIYEPVAAELTITAGKELTGRDLRAGEFRFQLQEKVGNQWIVRAETTNGAPVSGVAPVTFHMNYTFTDIGTHTYKIVEVNEGKRGVDYDTDSIELTVTVADDHGRLTASAGSFTGGVFTNIYTPEPVKLDIDAVLPDGVIKTLQYGNGTAVEGYDLTKFSFAVLKGGKTGADTGVQGTTDATGIVTFAPELVFTEAGEYIYTIKENASADSHVSIDPRVWTLKVVVSYDPSVGLLTMDDAWIVEGETPDNSTPVEGIEFKNTYNPDDTTLTLTAEKKVDGRDFKENEFTFRLLKKNAQGGYDLVEEVKNAEPGANGKAAVTFGALTYTYADIGEHKYKIVEVEGSLGGVTYDETEYEVTVTVTADLAAGKMKAEAVYPTGGTTFVNTYKAADAEVPITVYKELTGRTLKAGEFKFILKEKVDAGNKTRYTAVGEPVANAAPGADGKGAVTFNMTYTTDDVGTHEYIIVEVDEGAPGVEYSKKEFIVKVTVTDDGTGQIKAKVEMNEGATFTNIWENPKAAPETGDTFNAPLTAGVLALSAAALALLLFLNRRKKEDAAE